MHHLSPLSIVAIGSATFAIIVLGWFLFRRPILDRGTKVALFFGLGVFPIGAAATTNIEGYHATQQREFCGSCHVMGPHRQDSENVQSAGLASRHARNPYFGDMNCYVCHADYGMFGTVLTKMGGMRHVWLYYTEYKGMPLDEAREKIHLLKPFPNNNCMQCHSTKLQGWLDEPEHRSSMEDTRSGKVSCASAGCHGFAHPITKSEKERAKVPSELRPKPDANDGGVPVDGGAR